MDINIYDEIKKAGPKYSGNALEYVSKLAVEGLRRDVFIDRFSWAVPDKLSIQEIATFIGDDKCLEIGAGKGLWAYLLSLEYINITAVDNFNDKEMDDDFRIELIKEIKYHNLPMNMLIYKLKQYFNVEKLDGYKALNKYNDHNVLFLCWPRLNFTNKFKGNKIIYIGESDNPYIPGVPNKKEWNLVKVIDNPRWLGLHDRIELYERK